MPKVLGNADMALADCFKAFILGGDSLGSLFSKASGVIQAGSGLTSMTSLASHQVWEGNEPYLFNLVLKFYTLSDPYVEVEAPILALEKMMAPDVNKWNPLGRIPPCVQLNIGRKRLYNECVLTNMSIPMDKERNKDGNLIRMLHHERRNTMNVSTTKCDKNLEFIFKKIGKLEATLNALIAHLGLEMQVKDEPKGK